MTVGEKWITVKSDNRYEISDCGRVRRKINCSHPERSKPYVYIKPETDRYGYLRVRIGSSKYFIHRLVYEHFIGELKDGLVVCHLNNKKDDNRNVNLSQVTQRENIYHKKLHDTWQSAERHPRALISNQIAKYIKNELLACQRSKTGRIKRGTAPALASKYGVSIHVVYGLEAGTYGDAA